MSKEREKRAKQEKKEHEHREKQERKAKEKKSKERLRKIKEDAKKSHADIVEANPHADTLKLRTQTDGKMGTRTYRLSTTHGLTPERITKEAELSEARERGESKHHRDIRVNTRQTEITERASRLAKQEEEVRRGHREHEHKQKEMIKRRES